jgi:integrase
MIVRKRVYPETGRVKWQVDYGLVEGKRKVASFDSREEAERACQSAGGARKRLGMLGLSASPAEMAEFLVAKEKLRMAGTAVSISEAVEFYLTHARRMREVVMVTEAVGRFRDAKDAEGCSARYYRQLGVSLGALGRWLPERGMHEVRREEIETWLRGSGWAAKTRNNYLGDVRALFSWAMKEGFCSMNPAEGIAKARLSEEEIGTLSVGQCEVLLRGALLKPEMMGFVVLGLFGGLRPAEIQRLSWDAVDLREGTVIVAGSQAKTRRRRVVDLSEYALEWLRAGMPASLRAGMICGRYWDARWRMFRRSLGWAVGSEEKGIVEVRVKPIHGAWPHNALRHTYASMHYAMFENEAKLQAQMGHESASMLHRHYRALKTRKEAERFWGLKPE